MRGLMLEQDITRLLRQLNTVISFTVFMPKPRISWQTVTIVMLRAPTGSPLPPPGVLKQTSMKCLYSELSAVVRGVLWSAAGSSICTWKPGDHAAVVRSLVDRRRLKMLRENGLFQQRNLQKLKNNGQKASSTSHHQTAI